MTLSHVLQGFRKETTIGIGLRKIVLMNEASEGGQGRPSKAKNLGNNTENCRSKPRLHGPYIRPDRALKRDWLHAQFMGLIRPLKTLGSFRHEELAEDIRPCFRVLRNLFRIRIPRPRVGHISPYKCLTRAL